MDERYEAVDIVVNRTEGMIVTFADDFVAEFNLMTLRLECPCAECSNYRDMGQESWPRPGSPVPLEITTAELHGGWGLTPTWNDGHRTGIYPFEALRRRAERG